MNVLNLRFRKSRLDGFLSHLHGLFASVPATEMTAALLELKDAMTRLMNPRLSQSPSGADFDSLDFEQLRSLLDELAGKSLKVPNALERELRCDRFVTAYCDLKKLRDRAIEAAKQSGANARQAAMMNLLDMEPSRKYVVMTTSLRLTEERMKQMQNQRRNPSRNVKLFINSAAAETNTA
eukprot:gene41200-50275_t